MRPAPGPGRPEEIIIIVIIIVYIYIYIYIYIIDLSLSLSQRELFRGFDNFINVLYIQWNSSLNVTDVIDMVNYTQCYTLLFCIPSIHSNVYHLGAIEVNT